MRCSRWDRVPALARSWCDEARVPALALIAGNSTETLGPEFFGRQCAEAPGGPPLRDDAMFLIASITKPVVATGVMLLIERGQLSLGDRVTEFIPEFGKHGKYGVEIRHLLTHTSGLPDMLPNNRELRAAHAPLSTFVAETCNTPLSFPPGRAVQYQSMGYAILGEIIQRISGHSCAEFLNRELFRPLGMHDTALGAPESWFAGESPNVQRIAEVRLPPEQQDAADWNWNSRYWRTLGAPWGGLLTTPADLAKFCRMMLHGGRAPAGQLLSSAGIAAATRNQLAAMRDVPESEIRCRPWGLGWRLNWPAHSANFGDLLGPRTYGHWGATGTVLWIDPDQDLFAVILTTQPQEPDGPHLARLSNAIAAALS